MQVLVKVVMNSLYGVQIRKDINEHYYCISEIWMKTEYDETILGYWKMSKGIYIGKNKYVVGLHDDCIIKITLPALFYYAISIEI